MGRQIPGDVARWDVSEKDGVWFLHVGLHMEILMENIAHMTFSTPCPMPTVHREEGCHGYMAYHAVQHHDSPR